jgi:hypothetical protein
MPVALRILVALLARADKLVPLIAAAGELPPVPHAQEATARTRMVLVMLRALGA